MLRKQAVTYGLQWDKYLHGALWTYRNTPHDSSFLLFEMDHRQPMEAAFLPLTPTDTTVVINDYREELIKVLSSARQCAVESIQQAQVKYKIQHYKRAKPNQYIIGEWVLMGETEANRKLSRP